MPPQQECTLKLRSYYTEHRDELKGKAIPKLAPSSKGQPQEVTDPEAIDLTLPALISDPKISSLVCQEQSLCSSVLGWKCSSQDDADRAVRIIQSRLSPEAVLLLPVSVFDSALRSLLAKLGALTKPAASYTSKMMGPNNSSHPQAAPSLEFFSASVKSSLLSVAEAFRDIEETEAAMLAVGDLKTDPNAEAVSKAQVKCRWNGSYCSNPSIRAM